MNDYLSSSIVMLLSDDRMNAEDATASSSADDTATDADK